MFLYPIKHPPPPKKKNHLSIRTKQIKIDPDKNFQQIYQIPHYAILASHTKNYKTKQIKIDPDKNFQQIYQIPHNAILASHTKNYKTKHIYMLLYPIKHIYWKKKKKPYLSIKTKQTKIDPDKNFQQIYQILHYAIMASHTKNYKTKHIYMLLYPIKHIYWEKNPFEHKN